MLSFPNRPATRPWVGFPVGLLAIASGYLVILKILVARKTLSSSVVTGIQPQPFVVKEAEVYVKMPDYTKRIDELNREIADLEQRLDEKMDRNQLLLRERLHKLAGENCSRSALTPEPWAIKRPMSSRKSRASSGR